jgi:MoaA/NifB/PqqE/SkfB family radical SAM enzyme
MILWNSDNIKVFMDISTYCNAGCPQCHRTDENGLGKQDWLPLVQWDLKTFKKAFSVQELKKVNTFKFCGTWGDPVMAKELLEICKYIIKSNNHTRIGIDTNGSIRDEEWWWNLGVVCGPRLEVVFAVDGIDQKMHERYRRFTNLSKVLENMETLSMTKARVTSQTILFKHNQNYKEEIKKLVRNHGSSHHSFVVSDRFDKNPDGKRSFINEFGNSDFLEQADDDLLPNGKVAGTNKRVLDYNITCRWAIPRNEIVVNPDGQVMPCCFHANAHYKGRTDKTYGSELHDHDVYINDYNKNLEQYNVLHTPLSTIINSNWFTKKLPKSMNSDSPVKQCERQCSSRLNKTHQLREGISITNIL